jgi:UDP-glucose 4-epimerase
MEYVLVTGGCGFVGSNLIKRLLSSNPGIKKIVVMDNMFTGKEENQVDSPKVKYTRTPTWEIGRYFSDEEGLFDTVFHFGEYSRIVKSFDDIEYVMKTNLHGTACVLEKCLKWKAKLIYSASSSKFGNEGRDENLSPYAWAKSKMVELIKNYHDWFGLQYEICYFFNVYGPGQITKGDYATVIGIFERQLSEGNPLTVVEPGTQTRDFTHIEDIVSGVMKSSQMNLNREWHLRSGTTYSIVEIAQMFETKYEMIPERKGERFKAEDIKTDTNEVLGWNPEYTIKDYINEIIKDVKV